MSFVERRRFLWILFLAGLALIAIVAHATTFSRLRFDDLARESSAVARLRCLRTESRWEQGQIWTDARFEVLDTAKGVLPRVITVRVPGGRVAHLETHVDGAPRFHVGEEVYLFLWNGANEPYRVLGWAQGTFRIAKNPHTMREAVTQDSAATPIFDPERREFRAEGFRNMPVAEFRQRLQTSVERADSQ